MNKQFTETLTANEISNAWSAFMKNSMEIKFFAYFAETTEDPEISAMVVKMLNHRKRGTRYLEVIFQTENFAVPLGFTDEDVSINAPKVFSDSFILSFCYDIVLFSISVFSSALLDCVRTDIREYFEQSLEENIKVRKEIIELQKSKGIYLSFPKVTIDNEVDLEQEMSFLNSIFGDTRPINVSEIANLSRIINRAQFSKMVFVTFEKISTLEHLSKHFSKGKDEIQRVLDVLTLVLDKENIPISSSSDYQILDIKFPPFSNKLMLFFVNMCLGIFCFNMLTLAATSCLRPDLILKISKITHDLKFYYMEGVKLYIKEGWLERPPQSINK